MVKRTAIVHAWLFAVRWLAAAGCGAAPESVPVATVMPVHFSDSRTG